MPDGSGEATKGASAPSGDIVALRILATTDVHMNVLPYDYLADRPSGRGGLARTASLIARRRAEVDNCLLLDNGDFLEGTPLGDFAARRTAGMDRPHPAIAAMNALAYDAAALGNHDFSFGLAFLRGATDRARFPVLAANLHVRRGRGFAPYAIVDRSLRDVAGRQVPMRIGLVGFLPPQTAEWDRDLSSDLICDDIVATAGRIVPQMRRAGAQIVIALAHTGIGDPAARPGMENAATALAATPGIDAVIAGHTHQVFPGRDFRAIPGIDPQRGTLAGKPAVMAGFGGSHLGVIDLRLRRDGAGGWQVAAFDCRAEAVPADLPAAPEIARPVMADHRDTLRQLRRRVGRSDAALTSYFALIGVDPGLRLVNMAQRWHVRAGLRGTCWQDLPVLSASAPFRAGGRGGPGHYTDVPGGRLSLRSLSDLYSFPNRICAIRLDGAQLRDWLERAAGMFRRITPGGHDQPLLAEDFPCYNFDVVDGVTWQVDLSQPARFGPDGRLADAAACRIRDLCWQGRPLQDRDVFVLATNSYRLASCGLFSPLVAGNEVALKDGALTRDVLRHYIRRRRRIRVRHRAHWRFAPMPGTSVLFETGPGSLDHLAELERHLPGRLDHTGASGDGFVRFRLFL